MASSLAVELYVGLLQHNLRHHAPAELQDTSACAGLGYLPHQLRGFLRHYNILPITGYAYNRCIACSDAVLEQFKKFGIQFVLQVINQPRILEDITGLTNMKNQVDDELEAWDDEEIDDNSENSEF
jgi:ubiquitin-like modifier-activating enzyme ATG7